MNFLKSLFMLIVHILIQVRRLQVNKNQLNLLYSNPGILKMELFELY